MISSILALTMGAWKGPAIWAGGARVGGGAAFVASTVGLTSTELISACFWTLAQPVKHRARQRPSWILML